ncbi:hypothetical protein TCAL_14039, partial [Tigriopus californicus]|eukprot:TCALIF_14039-PA protein Name:"Protein of unknown function" AED:0.42 eAED:0.42 QI:92/1/0/1/1/0.5/2/0/507
MMERELFHEMRVYVTWSKGIQVCSKTNFDVFITDNSLANMENIKAQLHDLKIQSSMIFVLGSLQETLECIRNNLNHYNASSFFYLGLGNSSSNVDYYQVITFPLSNTQVLQKLELDANSKILEQYDLQGVEITSQSLDWHPYTIFEPNGTSYGHLIDMTHHLARLFNFTLRSIKEPKNDWGLQSQYLKNITGVLGNVIQGKVDLSLSLWIWNLERSSVVDFSIVASDWEQLCFVPQMPKVDPTLFLRPFTTDSWIAVGLTFLIIVVCALVPLTIQSFNQTHSFMIISTSGWYFFVLLNAFYGGALTMFFANEPSIPFSTVKDVVEAFPSWNVKIREGNEIFILANASPQRPEFQTLYNRVVGNPEENLFDTYDDIMNQARLKQVVFHTFARPFFAFLKENPQHKANLRVFAKEKPQGEGIIFGKNSPLVPIFNLGIQRLKENGAMDFLAKKWEGSFQEQRFEMDVMVLSGGQVILVYILMGAGYTLGLTFLLMECLWTKYNGGSQKP